MFVVDEILVSADILQENFVCNLKKCQGACCWEGDFGAPLKEDEIDEIEQIWDLVEPLLPKEQREVIRTKGFSEKFQDNEEEILGTPLMNDGMCAYLLRNEKGISRCSFEILHSKGKTDFKKPISCHLYPIRITENPKSGFKAMNYDRWDICQPACSLGDELKVPVYQFLNEAIIRAFGLKFYTELEQIFKDYSSYDEEQ